MPWPQQVPPLLRSPKRCLCSTWCPTKHSITIFLWLTLKIAAVLEVTKHAAYTVGVLNAIVVAIHAIVGRYAQSYHAMQTLDIGQVTPERFKLTDHRGRGFRGNVILSLNFLPEVSMPIEVYLTAPFLRFTSTNGKRCRDHRSLWYCRFVRGVFRQLRKCLTLPDVNVRLGLGEPTHPIVALPLPLEIFAFFPENVS